jgi:uncharacterized Zn finger protein (UPF0148 family)
MALHLDPPSGDPGEPDVRQGRLAGAESAAERRLLRDGAQVLAHGALVCPACDLPLAMPFRVPAGRALRCGFCDHGAPAREFLREDVYDTLVNEVYLVARIA